jgi:hypothetical protein
MAAQTENAKRKVWGKKYMIVRVPASKERVCEKKADSEYVQRSAARVWKFE